MNYLDIYTNNHCDGVDYANLTGMVIVCEAQEFKWYLGQCKDVEVCTIAAAYGSTVLEDTFILVYDQRLLLE